MKSKRYFNTSTSQLDPIFFLDRSLGKEKLAGMLREQGMSIQVHDDHFEQGAVDELWLAGCGKRNWVVITPDRRLEQKHRNTVVANSVIVFSLPDNNSRPEDWAACIKSHYPKILRLIKHTEAPFIAHITRHNVEIVDECRTLRKPVRRNTTLPKVREKVR